MVVVANTQVKNHGITSGDIILDRHERLGRMMLGLAAISESVDDLGSSTYCTDPNRTLCDFSSSAVRGDRIGILTDAWKVVFTSHQGSINGSVTG